MKIKSKFLNFIKYLLKKINNIKSGTTDNENSNENNIMVSCNKNIGINNEKISQNNRLRFNNRRCNIGKMLLRPINLKKGEKIILDEGDYVEMKSSYYYLYDFIDVIKL